MHNKLPPPIQQQINYYLEAGNFPAAKELYDLFAKICSAEKHKILATNKPKNKSLSQALTSEEPEKISE